MLKTVLLLANLKQDWDMAEIIQNRLLRARPPRVKITYDVETGGAIEKRELPFIVGIFADLSGDRDPVQPLSPPPLKERQMTDIDRDNFNNVMKTIRPRVDLSKLIQNTPAAARLLTTPGDKQIVFESMDDFAPMQIINQLPGLKSQYEARCFLRSLQANYKSDDQLARYVNEWVKDGSSLERLVAAQKHGRAAVIDELVARIDQQLNIALNAILHSAGFKQMEAIWRGLAHLVFNTETSTMLKLKLKVFNATQRELAEDLGKAGAFDQSTLFKLVYETGYGTDGGFPYSLLVGDYVLGSSGADIAFLKKISAVAAAAHAPFIAAASSELYGESGFDKSDSPRDLAKVDDNAALEAWREFREMEEARYVNLADAYARLAEVADYLMQQEPHSPVPYLIRRAIDWGGLNTGELHQEIFLKQNGQLNIYEMLGLQEGTESKPSP